MKLFLICSFMCATRLSFAVELFAVVEHCAIHRFSPIETIESNVQEYRRYIEGLKGKSVDLVVFPEYGLSGFTRNIEDYALDLNGFIVQELSTIASEHSVSLVVNLIEKDKRRYFNTNLVFDKSGEIIAKYRKININKALESTQLSAGNSTVEFNLEGTQFGILTNEDILFDLPTKKFSSSVSHVVIAMNWENEAPFGVSTSLQAGYALTNNKTLLAANLNNQLLYTTGSGIYSSIRQNIHITAKSMSKTILSEQNEDLMDYEDPNDLRNKNFLKFLNEENYADQQYDNAFYGQMETNTGLKCSISFNYQDKGLIPIILWSFLSEEKEVMVKGIPHKIRFCSFMACAGNEMSLCQVRYKNPNVTFYDITLRTNINPKNAFPITLDYNLKPLIGANFRREEDELVLEVKHVKNQMINSFAIVEYIPNQDLKSLGKNATVFYVLVCSLLLMLKIF